MNELTFQQIQGNGADEIASTGHELVQAFNENFELVKDIVKDFDSRIFHDLPVTSMSELDNLRSGSYRILLTVSGGTEQFYLLCTTEPDGRTIRQTRIGNKIYTRIFSTAWGRWNYLQESFLKSEYGDSKTDAITQSFFTEQLNDRGFIKADITSEDELDSLLEPGAYKITITGKIPLFFLLFITKKGVGTSSITTQLKLSDVEINTRALVKNYWSDWECFQKSFLKSSYGNSETDAITQKFFTDQLDARGFIKAEITSDTDLDDLRALGAYKVIIAGKIPSSCLLFVTVKGLNSINQIRLSEGNIYRRALINNTWSDWENETFRNKVMTKDEFEKLEKKNDDTFYFTYEDE